MFPAPPRPVEMTFFVQKVSSDVWDARREREFAYVVKITDVDGVPAAGVREVVWATSNTIPRRRTNVARTTAATRLLRSAIKMIRR